MSELTQCQKVAGLGVVDTFRAVGSKALGRIQAAESALVGKLGSFFSQICRS